MEGWGVVVMNITCFLSHSPRRALTRRTECNVTTHIMCAAVHAG